MSPKCRFASATTPRAPSHAREAAHYGCSKARNRSTDGDVRATLAKLAIPRKTFYDEIARHRIDLNDFRK